MSYYEDYELLEKLRELKNSDDPKKEINKMIDELEEMLVDNDCCPYCGNVLEAIVESGDCGTMIIGQRCTCCGKEFDC